MWYDILKIIVLAFGPIAVYAAFRATFEIPEVVAALPQAVQRAVELVGVLLVVGAWFLAPEVPFYKAMVFIGLILLVTPLAARKLSQFKGDVSRA